MASCATKPRGTFHAQNLPPVPDYSDLQYWAAHPSKLDSADVLPNSTLSNRQDSAEIDVFFLHPTTYTRQRGNRDWNGPIHNEKLKEKTNKFPIRFQATVFNATGRVYAPYYRQAHLQVYYTKKHRNSARKALNVAYSDVESAFLHYIKNENQGRPFIIASHSQGTQHAEHLIKKHVDGKALQKQLVVAYLIGMPVKKDAFSNIIPCESELETNCFCSWRTWQRGHGPKIKRDTFGDLLVTNPLTWKTSGSAEKEMNTGTLLGNYYKLYQPGLTDAEVNGNILWVEKPKFPWSFLFCMRNYHVVDINFFWMNLRENAFKRSQVFLTKERS
jgi:hypothetical protein